MGLIAKMRHAARVVMAGEAWGQGMPPSAMSDGAQGAAPASARTSSLYVDHRDDRELGLPRDHDGDRGDQSS